MIEKDITRLDRLRQYYADNGIMPTYSQMQEITDLCKNGCYKFALRMIKERRLKKVGNRIAPGDMFFLN